jgi:hypothetical protein
MEQNKITSIPLKAFTGMTRLTVLNLHSNKITLIPLQVFAGYVFLEPFRQIDSR